MCEARPVRDASHHRTVGEVRMHLGREHVALVVGRHVLARLDPDAGGAARRLADLSAIGLSGGSGSSGGSGVRTGDGGGGGGGRGGGVQEAAAPHLPQVLGGVGEAGDEPPQLLVDGGVELDVIDL